MQNFLHRKFPDLPGSKPVERAVTQVRKKGESPHDRGERIEAYITRLNALFKDERSFSLLKKKILNEYVTKMEEIPESYWKLQENIMRERGELGDWNNASEEEKMEIKKQNAEGVLDDQQSSLEQWLDYFASSDSKYIPDDIKYWVFRNILKLQEFDKEKKEFPKRSKGTIKQFPDINHEALGYVVDALLKKFEGKKMEFEHDIEPNERHAFEQYLMKEDFAKLYSWANELMNPIPEHLLPVTEGEWRKFDQGSDSHALVQTIRGKGTGWCTAGENTAHAQLEEGDFYCYYSLDDDGKPTIPRIAIRMTGEKITEVRGIAYKQNPEPYMNEVLADKLEEFPDRKQYQKKDQDMRLLTTIEKKVNQGQPLTREDLIFLYEVDAPIDGFGNEKDPRVETLLRPRLETSEDLPVIFQCQSNQFACNRDQIKPDTKVYIGRWTPEIMNLLPAGIRYVYEEFPGQKIFLKTIDLNLGITKANSLLEIIQNKGYKAVLDADIKDAVNGATLDGEEKAIELVSFSLEALGLDENVTDFLDILKQARKFDLEPCSIEIGLYLRLQYNNQPMWEQLTIAMEPMIDSGGRSNVLIIGRDAEEGIYISHATAWANGWRALDQYVFVRKK